jgi:hypothetical protein
MEPYKASTRAKPWTSLHTHSTSAAVVPVKLNTAQWRCMEEWRYSSTRSNFDSEWRWVVSLTHRPRVSCCQVARWGIPSVQRVIRYTTGERIWIYLVQNPDRKHLDFRAIRDEHAPRYCLYVTPQVPSSTSLWAVCTQVVAMATVATSGDKRLLTCELSRYCVHNKPACGDITLSTRGFNVTHRL